jgi:LmbE family N-acetylglucosaminyl deacetylase
MTAPRTIVSFHAHPDDEVLLTGGTLARMAAAGHRVVLVTATSGGAGLADPASRECGLAAVRAAELSRSARLLGCARVELLGYEDSGMDGTAGGPTAFCRTPLPDAAERLAAILEQEQADVLTVYDEHGGYGHPDHVAVHRVGVLAAQLAGTPRVLEATIDRDLLKRGVRAMGMLHLGRGIEVPPMAGAYLPRGEITHRVDVRAFTGAKRAAMAAHVSQAGGESADSRTLGLLLRLPRPLFRALLGHEWFAERGAARTLRPASTLFPGAEGVA